MPSPTSTRIRTYHMGFGDCFLLSFEYASQSARHVLIDFGTTRFPKRTPSRTHVQIARQIAADCSGKLHGVVATHRHADHISGFAGSAGESIAGLTPSVVVQPWTEDPDLEPDATAPTPSTLDGPAGFVSALSSMQDVSRAVVRELAKRPNTDPELQMLGIINGAKGSEGISNEKAVAALIELGRANHPEFAHHGMVSVLGDDIDGVKVTVLGPPTVDQSDAILRQRSVDRNEYWHLAAVSREHAARSPVLFPDAQQRGGQTPVQTRWLRDQLDRLRNDQLLQIVRSVDDTLNNTSLILLIEVGRGASKRRLLFSGDAQIENWAYTLMGPDSAKWLDVLAEVDLYKVGHHGSLNGTPRTLWNNFRHRSDDPDDPQRLRTIMSTMGKVHGSWFRQTEVPRQTLTDALANHSHHFSTQEMRGNRLFHDIVID